MKKPSRSALRTRADRAFSLYIRGRDKVCYDCGEPDPKVLQCAHIISRRYHAIRWSDDNAVALCRSCHMHYTHHPLEWMGWVTRYTPTGLTWDELSYLALNDPPERADEALARLRGAA